jgi:hypothetical protein
MIGLSNDIPIDCIFGIPFFIQTKTVKSKWFILSACSATGESTTRTGESTTRSPFSSSLV